MPPVQHQKETETCVGWACGYALSSYLHAKRNNNWTYKDKTGQIDSEKIFSPTYIFARKKIPCTNGINFDTAKEFYSTIGNTKFKDSPFVETECPKNTNSNSKHFQFFFNITSYTNADAQFNPDKIKRSLIAEKPIVVGIKIDKEFKDPNKYKNKSFPYIWKYSGMPARNKDGQVISHAVVCIGYNDTLSVDNKKIKAFKFLNSWGKEFGNDGYFWITYNDFQKVLQATLEPVSVETNFTLNTPQSEYVYGAKADKIKTKNTFRSWIAKERKNKSYYSVHFGLRLVLIKLNRRKKETIFGIYDINGGIKYHIFSLKPGDSCIFKVNNEEYQLFLINYTLRQRNILRWEANYQIKKI